jgi:hypothetical protein
VLAILSVPSALLPPLVVAQRLLLRMHLRSCVPGPTVVDYLKHHSQHRNTSYLTYFPHLCTCTVRK